MTGHVEPPSSCPLLPTTNTDDVELTCAATLPHITAADGRASVIHVIGKAGGVLDKTSVEQCGEVTDELFDVARRAVDDTGIDLHTDLRFATDVDDAILKAATETGATATVFTPHGGHSWWDPFSGAARDQLVWHNDRPVVILPAGTDGGGDVEGGT